MTSRKHKKRKYQTYTRNGDELETDMVLYAAGRSGNIRGLNCENAGIEIGERETVKVDENYRTNVPHIYATGDVIGFLLLQAQAWIRKSCNCGKCIIPEILTVFRRFFRTEFIQCLKFQWSD